MQMILLVQINNLIFISMEKNRLPKQSHINYIKQVITQFDIETQVNKITAQCFDKLLKKQHQKQNSHKQAFDFIAETQHKLAIFQTRLAKNQGFAQSIQNNVNSKIEVTNNLNKRLEVFSLEFYNSLKQNDTLVQTMRKDYDQLLSNNHKNTYDIRDLQKQSQKIIENQDNLQKKLTKEIQSLQNKSNQSELTLNSQLSQARKQIDILMTKLSESRAEMNSKADIFQEVTKDVALYKYERDNIDLKLKDIKQELDIKVAKNDFYEMRLLFDSQFTTERVKNQKSFQEIKNSLSKEQIQRKLQDNKLAQQMKIIKIQLEQSLKRQEVFNLNKFESIQNQISLQEKNQTILSQALVKLQSDNQIDHQKIFQNIASNFDFTTKQFNRTDKELKQSKEYFEAKIKTMSVYFQDKITDINDNLKKILELEQKIRNLKNDLLNITLKIENQIEKRKAEANKLQNAASNNAHANQQINRLEEELQNVKNELSNQIKKIKQDVLKGHSNYIQISKHQANFERQLKSVSNIQQITNLKVSQITSELNEAKQNANRIERQINQALTIFKQQIQVKLQFLNALNQQIMILKKSFEEQMIEIKAVNKSMSQKMQKTTAILTKFKSDLTMRVEVIVNEQQRRILQAKQSTKVIEELKKILSHFSEALTICLAINISRDYFQQQSKEPLKLSSLLEGWVIQIEQKGMRYRGDQLNKRKLGIICLSYLIFHGDKIKGNILENGKDVYLRMIEESQQIFVTRRKAMSKKGGSQLPKLHF